MIFKARRSYSAPATYLLGGTPLQGMDASGRADLPPARAAFADNLWREADDCVCKRKGLRLLEQTDILGRVEWMKEYEGWRYCYYIGADGGVLRREKRGVAEERPAEQAHWLEMGEQRFIFSKGAWIILSPQGSMLITPQGGASLQSDFAAQASPWEIDASHSFSPLIRAGGSPHGTGQGILPPNLLVPLVSESFVYTQSDRTAKRNRFCLALSPVVKGQLPTNADGTHADLNAQDSATRVATMNASARLEVRRVKSDPYGNTVTYWSLLSWSAADNINETDRAFWVQRIHTLEDLSYDGDDNVRITYFRPETAETQRLLNADAFALFGVGGQKDRIFAAAGSRIYYSGMDEGTYFGSLQYIDVGEQVLMLGSEGEELTALSDQSAWRITGSAESAAGEYALDAYFSVSARFPSLRPYGECIVAGNELLFYSERGLCAVAPSGVMDERNVQLRSERLWGLLQKEDPAALRMGVWKDMLLLAGEKGVYVFDLGRRVKSEEPYSSHAYEGYFWSITGVQSFHPSDKLCFFKDGQLYTLAETGQESDYHDECLVDGQLVKSAIAAVWETPPLGDETRCGTFLGLHLGMDVPTLLRVSYRRGGVWERLFDYDGTYCTFRYGDVQYGRWNYAALLRYAFRRAFVLRHRRALRLRFENDVFDSALRLRNFAVNYK